MNPLSPFVSTMVAAGAAVALLVGILLILAGKSAHQKRGLTDATTLNLVNRTLYSARLGLAGRPERIVEGHIPEEWKSSLRVYESHRAQLGAYFLLIEEESGVRPTHGFIVTGQGERHRIRNTPELRAWVLDMAEQIKAARRKIREAIPVRQPAAKCRACGMRVGCGQKSGLTSSRRLKIKSIDNPAVLSRKSVPERKHLNAAEFT